nr:glycosyltransferase [Lewinella sp. JB7]
MFLLAAAIQFAAWIFVFPRAFGAVHKSPEYPAPPPVSVIVCFHNEAPTLEACLRSILTQRPAPAEVIAVDDHSTDASAAIVRRLQQEFSALRTVDPGPTRPGKKDALTAGIAAATHPYLLLTDADCVPATSAWLHRMTAPFTSNAEVVLGCSPYRRRPGLLNAWQRFETTYVALQYQGFAAHGLPYMGVGRNLAYQKSFFQRAGGLRAHTNLPGGDDDLLVGHHATAPGTARVTDPAAWTYSAPATQWSEYIRQKVRHQSTGPRYRPLHRSILLVLAASHGLFFLLGLGLLFTPFWGGALLIYAVRAALILRVYLRAPVSDFLGGDAGAASVLLGDALLAPFSLFLAVATTLPPGRW